MGTLRPRKFVNGSRDRFGLIYGMPVGQIKIRSHNILSALSQGMSDANSGMFLASCVKLHATVSLVLLFLVVISFKFHSDVLVEHDS